MKEKSRFHFDSNVSIGLEDLCRQVKEIVLFSRSLNGDDCEKPPRAEGETRGKENDQEKPCAEGETREENDQERGEGISLNEINQQFVV